jgi:predicted ferric reductase
LPRLALYLCLGLFGLAALADRWLLVRRSIAFSRRADGSSLGVIELFKYYDDDKLPVQLTLRLKDRLKMQAGQYINMWIPSLGLFSRIQSYPFVVTSWTGKRQGYLQFVIEPRGSWTQRLNSRATKESGQDRGLGRVFFTGLHGISPPVDDYKYIFMVASGYGILAHLPLLERLIQGTRAQEVRACRIRLVWEFADVGRWSSYGVRQGLSLKAQGFSIRSIYY